MILNQYILTRKTLCTLLIIFLVAANSIVAQTGVPFNQRDDAYPLLGLKRAKAGYEAAKFEYEQKHKLFTEDLISEQELKQAKNQFADAEVNYQQSLLSVLFENQYVSIAKAVKYQSENGKKHVRVTLVNTSGSAEFTKLVQVEDALFRSLQPDVINDIYISLLNDDNAIISQPYEKKIEKLFYGKPVEIDFVLLQDLDVVSVNLVYSNGSQRTPKILLEKDASVNKVIVQSEQFSQVVELGSSAVFDLSLELFSGKNNTYKLETVNLPQQINHYFIDPESQARLSQFKFAERMAARTAGLQVYLPDRPNETVIIDQPIQFYVLAIPIERIKDMKEFRTRQWTENEIKKLDVGYANLELVPRGIGKLLVKAPQLYHAITAEQQAKVKIHLVNEGSRRIDNIKFDINIPFNWQKNLIPEMVSNLDIGEEKTIDLVFTPSTDVAVGRYEIRVQTSYLSDNQSISGEDKNITIEILPETNILGTIILILFIIVIIAGLVIFGIRLTRK